MWREASHTAYKGGRGGVMVKCIAFSYGSCLLMLFLASGAKGPSSRSYFCTTLSSYKSTCTTYFYIILVLLYDANFFFVQTVVHSTLLLLVSCTKIIVRVTFSMKGWIFVQNIAFLFYIPTVVFLCDCFFSISGCNFMWFSRFFA